MDQFHFMMIRDQRERVEEERHATALRYCLPRLGAISIASPYE